MMKRLFMRIRTGWARGPVARWHRRGWSPLGAVLLGGSILAGAALWVVAMVHLAERHP